MIPPRSAAAAYGLDAPTEADLIALLTKTAGRDAAAVVRAARAAAKVPPGLLSIDALEQVCRAVVAASQFPTTVSARAFLIRLGSFRVLSQQGTLPSSFVRPVHA